MAAARCGFPGQFPCFLSIEPYFEFVLTSFPHWYYLYCRSNKPVVERDETLNRSEPLSMFFALCSKAIQSGTQNERFAVVPTIRRFHEITCFELPSDSPLGSRCFLCCGLFVYRNGNAQAAGTGSIQGSIADATGAIIQNATVTATNVATQVKRISITERNGLYSFPNLAIGTYTLDVAAQGFEHYSQIQCCS